MTDDRNIILSAKDIEVKFRVRENYLTAIRGVSLDLYEGETFAIVGESGSGKSVFTKTFTGMLETNGIISNGSVMFHGKDLTKLKTDKDWEGIRGAKISTIFQDPMTSLNPIRTIGSQITEVIEKHQGISKAEAKAQAIEIMNRVGIPDAANRFDEYPFQYSGGMRQRIVIAIALSCHPEILICDEPTTALDVTIQAQIIEIFFDPRHPYTWALLSSLPQLGIKGQDLYYITGTPPSLYNKITGDAFAPRNEHALKIDFVEEPPFFKVSDTHYAKTWLLDPRAPKLEKPEVIRDLHEKIKSMTDKGGAFHVD